MENTSAVYKPIQTNNINLGYSETPELETIDSIAQNQFEDPHSKYEILRRKYLKLYKEHTFLLRNLTFSVPPSQDDEFFESFRASIQIKNNLIKQQEEELKLKSHELNILKSDNDAKNKKIDNLHMCIQDLVKKLRYSDTTTKTISRRRALCSVSTASSLSLSMDSLEISADLYLMNFLVCRLNKNQDISEEEILQYKMALKNIEEKFRELCSKLPLVY
ncbi:hypothetical protein SteCoe_35305 [Stentor coeruleus]|uniref:Uncharacterized protein n=1 Tax=Stentor coeruleus TaxID=5963 RepID=A0A1R2ASJ1_9CILI|nr:hypothetical protein SteCoe_35305 [Stentor coeruleus]